MFLTYNCCSFQPRYCGTHLHQRSILEGMVLGEIFRQQMASADFVSPVLADAVMRWHASPNSHFVSVWFCRQATDGYFAPDKKTYRPVKDDYTRGTEVNEWTWSWVEKWTYIGGWFQINCDLFDASGSASCATLSATENAIINGEYILMNEWIILSFTILSSSCHFVSRS
jgi:hypothetical protein